MKFPLRFFLFVAIQFLAFAFASSQSVKTCATDILRARLEAESPLLRAKRQAFDQMVNQQSNFWMSMRMAAPLMIPVVVHIVHNNGPENISNTQVQAGIDHLNLAFANLGYYQENDGVDIGIQFCLALRDSAGNASNGITRTFSPLTNLTAETQDSALKQLIRWDPTQYLNIYLVKEITSVAMGSGVAGYAYFPSSHGNLEDGIVNEARWFGANFDDSKIHIHEAGHYLGLYHTFEGGCTNNDCQNDGDHVCDTPPDNSTAVYSCGATPNTCLTDANDPSVNNPFRSIGLGGLGDQPDMIRNYMDYGSQACQTALTAGQKARMNTALTGPRVSLLNSPGCQTVCTNPIVGGFNSSLSTVPLGGTVNFTNTTSGATGYNWTVNGTPFASTFNSSYLFNSIGYFIVTLTANNSDPACDHIFSDTILVQCPVQASFTTSATSINPGTTVNFVNSSTGSTGSTTWSWLLDNMPVASTLNYSRLFNGVGGFTVNLIACDNGCCDTSMTTFIQVGSCPSREIEVWYFGAQAGVTFASGAPVALTNGAMTTSEGCASICDANGNILMYSNGVSLWDRSHTVMPNGSGLMGHLSSTQSAFITPWPDSTNRYLVFTTDAIENGGCVNGLRYNVVDMNLIGGLGDIIPNMKNLPLFTTSPTERVSGTWHSNGRDIWILTHKNGNSEFYAYLVTPTGVNLTPVISNVGAVCQMQLHSLRISPNGKKVAMSHVNTSPPRAVEILDFNPANGVLSNPIYVSSAPGFSWQQPYGLEFSPDNSKVYITTWNGSSYLHQIDLAAGSPSAIIASIQTVYSHQFGMGHLTLGPNGKIYSSCTALGNVGKLISIENPNLAGTACNVLVYGVDLLGRVSGSSTPNTFPGFYRTFAPTIVGADTVCQSNVPFTYQATNVSANDSTSWELTTGITPSTLALDSANLVFTSLGTHRIVLHKWNACGYRTDSMDVTVVPGISISLGRDTALCTGGITLSPGPGYATYLWQNNSSASSLVATAPGTYWVEVNTMGGCRARDTIIVYGATGATVNLGPDISFCQGTVFNLNAGPGFANYFWQNGWTQQTFTGWVPGSYIVRATDHCGNVSRDTINVTANNPNLVNLGADSSVCDGSNYTLNAGNGFVSYLWQNGNTTPTMVTSQTGLYWVEVIDAQGCVDRDSISLTFATSAQPPNAAYSYSLAVWTANFTSGATGSAITYFWDFGDGGTSTLINPTHTFPGNGTYRVCLIVTDDCNRADTVCRNISVVYVGNEAIEEEISVLLYPNPSSGDLSVWFQSPENGTMKIISVIGREVVQEILYSGRINEFDFQSISTGVYIIEIESDGKKRVQKWVKE